MALLAIAFLFVVGLLLTLTTDAGFVRCCSRRCRPSATVGASHRASPRTTDGRHALILMVAMFVGRLGPLTLVLALAARARPVSLSAGGRIDPHRLKPEEEPMEQQVMVVGLGRFGRAARPGA